MRFFFPLLTLAAAIGLTSANPVNVNVARQPEAARFGVVNVSPSTVKFGEPFIVTYNSTEALAQPIALDVYLQPTLADGFVEPYYLLGRFSDYPNITHFFAFQKTLPVLYNSPTNGYVDGTTYEVWAFITYPSPDGGAYVIGGTSYPLSVDLS